MEELSVKKKRVMMLFIEAAEELLRKEGPGALSIRKVASEAGYNSATLYNYFQDLEHLTLFASVRYLREYVALLEKNLTEDMNAFQRYRMIYRCFNTCAFREPEIFHGMFFGRHSGLLGEVLQVYYEQLFPQELDGLSGQMKQMLRLGTMYERDSLMMKDLVAEGFVAPEKVEKTMELMIALHQHYIHEAMIRSGVAGDFDPAAHQERFDAAFLYIMEAARP
ncbi:MAG: TetR/AcrR family transcriptional regulator [Anaerovoracaceae bacterium]